MVSNPYLMKILLDKVIAARANINWKPIHTEPEMYFHICPTCDNRASTISSAKNAYSNDGVITTWIISCRSNRDHTFTLIHDYRYRLRVCDIQDTHTWNKVPGGLYIELFDLIKSLRDRGLWID